MSDICTTNIRQLWW